MRERFFLSRLFRESLLTPCKPSTLEAGAGEGCIIPSPASRRVRGLGQSPKVWVTESRMNVVEESSEGQA